MIDVIGTKRLSIILLLVALNVLMAVAGYLYLIPQEEDSVKRLRAVKSEVSAIQSNISTIQREFEELGVQQADFEKLKQTGFFNAQTRNEAKILFQTVQDESGVISALVTIKPGAVEENLEAQKAKHKILSSAIEVDIQAMDDTSIYKYISLIQQNFIGNLSIDVLEIRRMEEVTPLVLSEIAEGRDKAMVTAKLVFNWRTMIPETQVITVQGVP
jgi:hypothetical protein